MVASKVPDSSTHIACIVFAVDLQQCSVYATGEIRALVSHSRVKTKSF